MSRRKASSLGSFKFNSTPQRCEDDKRNVALNTGNLESENNVSS